MSVSNEETATAIMHLYSLDGLAEAKAELDIENITLKLLEIQEFFNENHDEKGLFTGPGAGGGPSHSEGVGSKISAAGHEVLNQVNNHLNGALGIVGKATQEGSLIARVMNGIKEVQKGSAARKASSAAETKKETEAIMKLPRWRDSNPSKGSIARVGELLNKAASTIKNKWAREPEFRKDVYKEAALAITGLALHIASGPLPEALGLGHAAVEGLVKTIDVMKKAGEL
jgi:hypothetical protein